MHAQLLQIPPLTLFARHLDAPHPDNRPHLGLTHVGFSQLQGIWYMTLAYFFIGKGVLDMVRIVLSDHPDM